MHGNIKDLKEEFESLELEMLKEKELDWDEKQSIQKIIEKTKKEINKITERFKELKTLVYNYRDLKEKEISELSKKQDNLKNEIEINRNNYETLVDKATLELENFIKRNDPDSKIQ